MILKIVDLLSFKIENISKTSWKHFDIHSDDPLCIVCNYTRNAGNQLNYNYG